VRLTLTNIANQQTTTQKRDTTTTIGKASNLKGKNIKVALVSILTLLDKKPLWLAFI
jgi:hypothetical protein